jgi:surface carbohydrate biosynthesis protein
MDPRSARVALVVDNPFRDLPGLVLTARALAQRGMSTFLVPMNIQVAEIGAVAPDFVLMNYLRKNNQESVRLYQNAGIGTGILDTEGSVFSPVPRAAISPGTAAGLPDGETLPIWEEYALTMAQDPRVRGAVECYCAWTQEFADYFGAQGRYDARRIVVTGTPRSDFYAEPWRTAVQSYAGHRAVYGERMILVNGSFPLANPRFQTPEREVEQLIQEFSYDRDFAYGWQRTQSTALLGLAALVNRLAARFPDVAFVYRPHPFEGTERYADLLERLPNLHLVKEGTVDGWLLSARAMLHWGSSTAVEGNLAGTPVFTPGWLPTHLPVPAVDAVSLRPSNEAELVGQLEAVLAGTFRVPDEIRQASELISHKVFHRVDGRSHERVAAAIEAVIASRTARPDPTACEQLAAIGWGKEWSTAVQTWDASEKRFTADQVQRMLDALDRVAPDGAASTRATASAAGHSPFALPAARSVTLSAEAATRDVFALSTYPKLQHATRALQRSWRGSDCARPVEPPAPVAAQTAAPRSVPVVGEAPGLTSRLRERAGIERDVPAQRLLQYLRHRVLGRSYRRFYARMMDQRIRERPDWGLDLPKRFQLEYLVQHGMQPGSTLLDYGCGAVAAGLHMIEYLQPGHYTGVDISEGVLAEALRRVRAADLARKRPTLWHLTHGRLTDLPALPRDFVWAQSVLTHMPPDDIRELLGLLPAYLAPGGRVFATITRGEREVEQRSLKDWRYSVAAIEEIARSGGFSVKAHADWRHPHDPEGLDTMLELTLG